MNYIQLYKCNAFLLYLLPISPHDSSHIHYSLLYVPLKVVIIHWLQFMMFIYFWIWCHSLECGHSIRYHTFKENCPFLLQKPSTIHKSLVSGRGSCMLSHNRLESWLASSCAGTHRYCEFMSLIMSRRFHLVMVLPDLWLLQSFCSIFWDNPNSRGRSVIKMSQVSSELHSLLFSGLCPFVMFDVAYHLLLQKILCWGSRVALNPVQG